MAHVNKLIISLEKWDIVVGEFLEFSKTFDTVDHDIFPWENKCSPWAHRELTVTTVVTAPGPNDHG